MKHCEIISIVLNALTVAVTFAGVYVAYSQLKENTKSRREDTDWKRKVETEQKLSEFKKLTINKLTGNPKFDYLNNKDNTIPLDLSIIKNEIKNDREIRNQIHKVLNFYESLARGIKYNFYDENIIRMWGENKIKRMFIKYQYYIEDRRKSNPNAWQCLVDFIFNNME